MTDILGGIRGIRHRMLNSFPGLYPLDFGELALPTLAVTAKTVSRHPDTARHPPLSWGEEGKGNSFQAESH